MGGVPAALKHMLLNWYVSWKSLIIKICLGLPTLQLIFWVSECIMPLWLSSIWYAPHQFFCLYLLHTNSSINVR